MSPRLENPPARVSSDLRLMSLHCGPSSECPQLAARSRTHTRIRHIMSDGLMQTPSSSHVDLQAAAERVMLENGFDPAVARRRHTAVVGNRAPSTGRGRRVKTCAICAACSGRRSTTTRRAISISSRSPSAARRDDESDGGHRGRRRLRAEGFSDRPARRAPDDDRVHGRQEFLDAAGAAVDGHHVAAGRRPTSSPSSSSSSSGPTGSVQSSTVYRAVVRNAAQLAYNGVGAWLEGRGPAPPKVAASSELQAQLRLQDAAAQALRSERYRHGALNIETIETRPILAERRGGERREGGEEPGDRVD